MYDQNQIEIIRFMERFELNIHNLYNVFALKFPRLKQFWRDLALEEKSHAFMLQTFREMIEEGTLHADQRPFSLEEIRKNIEMLNEKIDKAIKTQLTLIEAIHTAIDIESSMLERKLFEIYQNDPQELKKILIALQRDTERHFNKLKEQYEEILEVEP